MGRSVRRYRNGQANALQSSSLHWGDDTRQAVGLGHRFDPFITGLLKRNGHFKGESAFVPAAQLESHLAHADTAPLYPSCDRASFLPPPLPLHPGKTTGNRNERLKR